MIVPIEKEFVLTMFKCVPAALDTRIDSDIMNFFKMGDKNENSFLELGTFTAAYLAQKCMDSHPRIFFFTFDRKRKQSN